MKINRKEFESHIIARDDDQDYRQSGYAACLFENGNAAIFSYSHCSCYGTWESISGHDDYSYDDQPLELRDVTPCLGGNSRRTY